SPKPPAWSRRVPVDDCFAVLVVDDDPDIRETFREVMEAEGCRVVCAEDGAAALDMIARGLRPTVVVLDLMMPAMSGWEVLSRIRADRSLADMPVVVMSAAGNRTIPPGATQFLKKPVDLDTVIELAHFARARAPKRRERMPSVSDRMPPSAG